MRIIPLARKARELTRGREVREKAPHHPARWAVLAIVFVLTVLITSPTLWEKGVPTREGQQLRAPVEVTQPFEFSPENLDDLWEEQRRRNHLRIFLFDSRVHAEALRIVEALGRAAMGQPTGVSPESLRAALAQEEPRLGEWPGDRLADLYAALRDQRVNDALTGLVASLYQDNVLTPDKARYQAWQEQADVKFVAEGRPSDRAISLSAMLAFPAETDRALDAGTRDLAVRLGLSPPRAEAVRALLALVVRPNLRFSEEQTAAAYRDYESKFPRTALVQRFKRGDRLFADAAGFPVVLGKADAALLKAYSDSLAGRNRARFGSQVLFVLLAFLIISFFVQKFSRELEFTSNSVLLLALPTLLALGLGRVFLQLAGESVAYVGFAFPAGVIGILGVLLLDVRLALLMVTWGCLLFGLEANLRYEFVIVGLFGGYTAVAALFDFRERREVLYAGLIIGFVNAATILIISVIGDSAVFSREAAIVGLLSGIMCSLISFAVLPVFEVAFHITTDMRLLELSGLQHPVLRKLEEIAPGTWQHTLNVAKLAESAATAIGANYLLVRAGCYFHDIGKMSKPEYFTENQATPEDKKRHAELKPQMSTLIIRNHVKEGLEIARRHNLPKVVEDFIPQHHGTSLIQYFYHKALTAAEKGDNKEPVREDEYRYTGPKPQSIETAIVMLADTVEATATAKLSGRAVRDDDIQMLVRNAIFEKFNDGQFDNCNLTMRDLNSIRESFVKTLRSRYHARIDYPSMQKKEQPRPEPKAAKAAGDDDAA